MIYDAVKSVLTALDAQGEADFNDWNEQIAERLLSLEVSYRELRNADRELIDYSELATQAAYVFRYVLGHADFICDFLQRCRDKVGAPLFEEEELWVTSIGGGPGSELLGLVKYLAQAEGEPDVSKIIYTVIDKERNWEHVTELVAEYLGKHIEVEVIFQEFNVESAKIPDNITLKDEDVVFMSFFISEVCALPNNDQVSMNISSILSGMRDHALLVYKDSDAYSFYNFFNGRVRSAKRFDELIDIKEEFRSDAPKYDGIIEDYIDEFDYRPKLSGRALSKLLRRVPA